MSHSEIAITVAERTAKGKGANKRLRRTGKIPCVLYGHGVEPVSLTAELKEVIPAIDHPSIITVNFEGKKDSRKALIKEIQHDCIKSSVIHIDLQQVKMDETITAEVPLEVTGHPIGLQHGGQLDQIMHNIEVECLPNDLPDRLVYDVSHLDIGDNVAIEDIPVPDGVKVICADSHTTAIHVIRPRLADIDEETEEGVDDSAGPEVIVKPKKEDTEQSS